MQTSALDDIGIYRNTIIHKLSILKGIYNFGRTHIWYNHQEKRFQKQICRNGRGVSFKKDVLERQPGKVDTTPPEYSLRGPIFWSKIQGVCIFGTILKGFRLFFQKFIIVSIFVLSVLSFLQQVGIEYGFLKEMGRCGLTYNQFYLAWYIIDNSVSEKVLWKILHLHLIDLRFRPFATWSRRVFLSSYRSWWTVCWMYWSSKRGSVRWKDKRGNVRWKDNRKRLNSTRRPLRKWRRELWDTWFHRSPKHGLIHPLHRMDQQCRQTHQLYCANLYIHPGKELG